MMTKDELNTQKLGHCMSGSDKRKCIVIESHLEALEEIERLKVELTSCKLKKVIAEGEANL